MSNILSKLFLNPNIGPSWTLYQREDMNGELAWLVQELQAAEDKGELVHLINHIPPGNSDCMAAWGREFARIIDR
jgi:sphingomyelin phosphodiesterase